MVVFQMGGLASVVGVGDSEVENYGYGEVSESDRWGFCFGTMQTLHGDELEMERMLVAGH